MHIALLTGSRADWGLLKPVAQKISVSRQHRLSLWVTGSHLEASMGNSQQQIVQDGFTIDARIALNIETHQATDTAEAMARALQGCAQVIAKTRPDLLLVLGDRYEVFAATQAAALACLPIAHIAGGDITEGAYDDGFRHAISKLAHIHFPTNAQAAARLRQLGESPNSIYMCGSPGIDNLLATPRLSQTELAQRFHFTFQAQNILVSFHPATLGEQSLAQQLEQLIGALKSLPEATGLLLSGSNADLGGAAINQAFAALAAQRPHTAFVTNFGNQAYYSALVEVDLLMGNSSSALYEAPSLQTASLDIGQRQQGRLKGPSVRHCDSDSEKITQAMNDLLNAPPSDFSNPYGNGNAANCIVNALDAIIDPQSLLRKRFYEVKA